MTQKISIAVNRTEGQIVIVLPEHNDITRGHALINEEEAYVLCVFIRRMIASRDLREVQIGNCETGLRVLRVRHSGLPIEIHIDDENGSTIVDLNKDDSLSFADMLWGAHRATDNFHSTMTISGNVRQKETPHNGEPRQDSLPDDVLLAGEIRRRIRGEIPRSKI